MYMNNGYDIINCAVDNQDDYMLRTANEINLYDLMGENHSVWLKKNHKFGFDLEIENESGQTILEQKQLHPYAVEALADFCKDFLHFYSKNFNKE